MCNDTMHADLVAALIESICDMSDEFDADRHECLKTWQEFEVATALGVNYTMVPKDFYSRLACVCMAVIDKHDNKDLLGAKLRGGTITHISTNGGVTLMNPDGSFNCMTASRFRALSAVANGE